MNRTANDFVTVEMRGLKAALVAHAQARRVSVSALVRDAVMRELCLDQGTDAPTNDVSFAVPSRPQQVKLSIRLTADEVDRFNSGARAAGLSRGAYLAGLVAAVPVLSAGGGRAEHISALRASTAELSTMSRNIHRLTAYLRQSDLPAARQYREMLDTLAGEVRGHLMLAARVLAELQPARARSGGLSPSNL